MSNFPTSWTARDLHGQDDDEEEEEEFEAARDAVLFAIDARGRMLEQRETGSSLLPALKAILTLMKKRIIAAPKDMIGIIVYNVEQSHGIAGSEFDKVHILQDVLELDAPMIKKLKDLIASAEEDPEVLKEMFKTQDGPDAVGQALHTCNHILRGRAQKSANKSIYLVTDTEDPYPAVSDAPFDAQAHRTTALTFSSDCAEMGFRVTPFFVVYDEHTFDVKPFYKDFLLTHVELDEEEAEKFTIRLTGSDSDEGWSRFTASTAIKPPPKRSAFSIPFIIGERVEISINGYNTITEAKKGLAIKVDLEGAVPREIVPQTTYHDADAGAVLDPKKDIRTYFPFGSKDDPKEKKVVFEDDEREELRTVGQKPGLRLLGFLDPESIPVEHFVRHTIFIYPSEASYLGSTRLFTSLLKVMVEKGVAGLGLLVSRKNSTPQHVLMLPQEEVRNEDDMQVEPPGIHLIQLAYADDIRPPPDSILKTGTLPATRESNPQMDHPDFDTAKKIMTKLRFKDGYTPESYENPALHYHYAVLEALALQESEPEPKDSTIPRYINITKRAGELMEKLTGLIDENPESHYNIPTKKVVTSNKRKRDEEPGEPPDEAMVVDWFKQGKPEKLKRDEMIAFLASTGVSFKKGTKAVLAEAITEYLNGKGLL